ncbi:MAG: PEP-CTERM sorting domain-containing protein [Roseiarcus sp.]
MKYRVWTALPLLAGLCFAGSAQALTVNFSFGGDGNASGSGTLTVGSNPYADKTGIFGTLANLLGPSGPPPSFSGAVDPANSLAITGAIGLFSDLALGINGVGITGVLATNPQNHFDPDQTIPHSFGWYPAPGSISYDNLFYPGGAAPITCIGVPPGGLFDDYGVLFTLANGDLVDLYSNGGAGPGDYGVVVWADGAEDKTSMGGLSVSTPEPSTWAMMVLGFTGLGFAGYRSSRKTAGVVA